APQPERRRRSITRRTAARRSGRRRDVRRTSRAGFRVHAGRQPPAPGVQEPPTRRRRRERGDGGRRGLQPRRLDPPNGIVTTMAGGHFDGARFAHSYTPLGDRTKVDLEGDFPALPGTSDADELAMIDGFFTMTFGEDAETIRVWSPNSHE